ncbi:MAG: pilus assembly protein TadG-related protein [Rhizobiaceae bacterium]
MFKSINTFIACERGNFAILVAGLALPMFTLIAGALDYSELVNARRNIQHSSDAAVLSAFNAAPHGWGAMQNDARAFFEANLANKSRLSSIKTKLTRKIVNKNLVLSYNVKVKVKSLFGEFNPLGKTKLNLTSTAVYNYKTRRRPYIVPNNFNGRKGHGASK